MEIKMTQINDDAMDLIFRNARTHTVWQNKPVEDSLLERVYDLCKWGPTSMNCCPMRITFIKSKEAKERLKPCLAAGNVEKTMSAPAIAIIAYDMAFYEKLPVLFPHMANAKDNFVGKEEVILATATRNGTLQGGYFIIAARALGLDCGPMSGFDNAKVDAEFFKGTTFKSNFLCNLGYGEPAKLFPRSPRLSFREAASIL